MKIILYLLEIKLFLDDNNLINKIINNDVIDEIESHVDENDRNSRKLYSRKICKEIDRMNNIIKEKLSIVRKFENKI